jgi:transposase-like protein
MARHRSFSSEFKRQLAKEFLDGRAGLHELAHRHSLSRNLIRLWIRKYEAGELTDELAEAVYIAQYERKISELRAQGRATDDGSRSAQKRGAVGTPAQRRELLYRERPEAVSVAGGCRIMKLARSTYFYRSRRRAAAKKVLRDRAEAPCAEFPRDGYRSHETF